MIMMRGQRHLLWAILKVFSLKENYRKKGYARELVEDCEKWARKKCKEFASDCLLENTDSLKFHLAIGFIEVNRIICFKKILI